MMDCDNSKTFQLTTSRRGRQSDRGRPGSERRFNSRPHEEVDLLKMVYGIPLRMFQLTTSRRGRLCFASSKLSALSVSTHDLTKRSTGLYGIIWDYIYMFQLTTSRRGRQQFLRKKFSFQNHFLCSLHIIYSYYINTIFFSTLFLAKSSFFLVRIL